MAKYSRYAVSNRAGTNGISESDWMDATTPPTSAPIAPRTAKSPTHSRNDLEDSRLGVLAISRVPADMKRCAENCATAMARTNPMPPVANKATECTRTASTAARIRPKTAPPNTAKCPYRPAQLRLVFSRFADSQPDRRLRIFPTLSPRIVEMPVSLGPPEADDGGGGVAPPFSAP